jgi:hypothetical protein
MLRTVPRNFVSRVVQALQSECERYAATLIGAYFSIMVSGRNGS